MSGGTAAPFGVLDRMDMVLRWLFSNSEPSPLRNRPQSTSNEGWGGEFWAKDVKRGKMLFANAEGSGSGFDQLARCLVAKTKASEPPKEVTWSIRNMMMSV